MLGKINSTEQMWKATTPLLNIYSSEDYANLSLNSGLQNKILFQTGGIHPHRAI